MAALILKGVIVSCKANSAVVRIAASGFCSKGRDDCPLSFFKPSGDRVYVAHNPIGALPGMPVIVQAESPQIVVQMTILFLLPLLLLVCGYGAGAWCIQHCTVNAAFAHYAGMILGLVIAFICIALLQRKIKVRYTVSEVLPVADSSCSTCTHHTLSS